MTIKKKKIMKIAAIVIGAGLVIGLGIGYYMFNMPHRDVQASPTDYKLSVSELVGEYLVSQEAANTKYLAKDGNSKILEVTGEVFLARKNMNDQMMVVLQRPEDIAGVNATFTSQASERFPVLERGQEITIKGVIRSGVYYDDNMQMYVNAIIDYAALVAEDL
jgi:hypothetical protein